MGTDIDGSRKLLSSAGVAMNGVEFIFALMSVTGMTALHFVWIGLAYKLENSGKKKKKESSPKHEMVDDIIDYDGMGQGRFVSENRR